MFYLDIRYQLARADKKKRNNELNPCEKESMKLPSFVVVTQREIEEKQLLLL